MLDLITIGDVGIDTYYLLDSGDATVRHLKSEAGCELCFDLSEKIPVEEVHTTIGGNAANAAVGATKLGLNTSIVTTIGDDEDGRSIIYQLEKADVDLRNITRADKTNQTVALIYKGQRTLLVHHEERKYEFGNPPAAKWLYLTSTNIGGEKMNDDIVKYAQRYNARIVFSPGTIQRKAGPRPYGEILRITDVIIMNKEEAQDYTGVKDEDVNQMLDGLIALGPRYAVITDATAGSYASDSTDYYRCEAHKVDAIDSTGAGDAYASALTAALVQGKTLEEAMKWGSINAASVVQKIGPQLGLLSLTALQHRLADFNKKDR